MLGAMNAVRKDGVGVNAAAAQLGVPTTTLRDQLSGRVVHGNNPGPAPYLLPTEESELVEYLHSTSRVGYGKTRRQVMNIVGRVAKKKGTLRKGKVTCGWFRSFKRRNPSIRLRKGDSMAAVRFQCTSAEIMGEYFDLLEKTLEELELSDKPGQIYNVDETGMSLDPPKQKLCASLVPRLPSFVRRPPETQGGVSRGRR